MQALMARTAAQRATHNAYMAGLRNDGSQEFYSREETKAWGKANGLQDAYAACLIAYRAAEGALDHQPPQPPQPPLPACDYSI